MTLIPGTNLASKIVPFDSLDTYPTHDSVYGIGGWREVADTTARDAIPATRLRAGMVVYVTADNAAYLYNGVGWSPLSLSGVLSFVSWLPGKPLNGAVLLEVKCAEGFVFAPGLTGWQVAVGTNPAATAVYDFKKNNASFGTLSIATSGTPTWTSAAGATFAIGDVFTIVAPSPQDTSLSDVSITSIASGGTSSTSTSITIGRTGQVASISNTVIYTVATSGLFRLTYDLLVTTAGTAGVLYGTFTWNNGHLTQTPSTEVLDLTVVGSEVSKEITFFADTATTIMYSTTLSGGLGDPDYAIRIQLESI